MSTTIFLRFPDEAAFLATMPGFVQSGETGSPLPDGVTAISIVGTVAAVPGHHVNALGTIPAAWQQYVIATPATPWRIFGGP